MTTHAKPILTVEFTVKIRDGEFKEESVSVHSPEELLAFVAPGGGCERIPDEVEEIQMVFLPPAHRNAKNPLADTHATLQLGMVFFSGPVAEVVQTAATMLDRAGRGELAASFLKVIGATV